MRNKKLLFIVAFSVMGVAAALAYFLYQNIKEAWTIHTSRDAPAAEVTFLDLPPTTSRIGYWRDGLNFWAEFDISEIEFRKLFSNFQFEDISKPIEKRPKTFGDLEVFPVEGSLPKIIISSGLRYLECWDNGGGVDIVYDRPRGRAYYDHSRR